MTRILHAPGIEKNHPELSGYARAVIESMPGDNALVLSDADGETLACRHDDRRVTLGRADRPALVCSGSNHTAIAYDPANLTSARAAMVAASVAPGEPVAADSGSIALLTLARRVAQSEIPVVIEGPTGTGKEVLARFIHNNSMRASGPFVAVNCAAMPEAMLETMLFGHRKGAFTGASETTKGLFRAADGGTLLLDELGEMPLGLQAKLLRALQEGEVTPLGATEPVKFDTRIIACTNRDLPSEVAAGRFREDLYFRLNVFPLRLAALRERRDDIAPLAFSMLMRHAPDPATVPWIDAKAIARLVAHNWAGNVRELENVVRRALLLVGDADIITTDHITIDTAVRPLTEVGATARTGEMTVGDMHSGALAVPGDRKKKLSSIVRQSETQVILDMLEAQDGNRQATAKALGISERTLRYRLASMREAGTLVAGAAR